MPAPTALNDVALARVIKRFPGRTDPFLSVFYLACLGGALFLLLLPAAPALQAEAMRAQHGRAPSFARWAAWRALPSMYHFAHRVFRSEGPCPPRPGEPPGPLVGWLNHFPLQAITFGGRRLQLYAQEGPARFYLESRFQGRLVGTCYRTERKGGVLEVTPVGEE